jgi:hypothetical protein
MKNTKHFYHHIVAIDSLHLALSDLDLDQHEKDHLIIIAETNIHHSIIDTILSELTNDDKKTFLILIAQADTEHNQIWDFLNLKIEKAESKIKNTVEKMLQKMHEDIKATHSKK